MRNSRTVAIIASLSVLCMTFVLGDAHAAPKTAVWKGELPIRQPWLRDHLADDSLAYVRVPHLFGLLSMPKGSALDVALRSKANIENVEKIRRGITNNVLPQIPGFANVQLRLLEQHLRSPIEVAFFLAEAPSALISVNLDLDSDEALAEVLELMGVPLLEPLDEQGIGQVGVVPIPVFLQFEAATGQLLIHAGPAVTAVAFEEALAATERNTAHAMTAMEDRVDQSGQGFFLWIDSQRALPLLQSTLPPEQAEAITASGLSEVSSAAVGWGVANGKGRLSIVADLPDDGERGFLPYVSNDLSATTVGEPDGLLVLSIPTAAEFSRMESLALDSAETETQLKWAEGKTEFEALTGVAVEEIFEAIGPEVLMIFDQAGDYLALRVRDARLWSSIVSRVGETTGRPADKRRVGGKTYYHASMPNEFGFLGEELAGDIGWYAVLLGRQRDHFYWTQDGDFLYIASVPQVLLDRAKMRAGTSVAQWLQERQRIDADEAVLSVSGTGRKLPKRLYAVYIEVLQLLADLGETEIDVWSMPTAEQLGLPDIGTLGFTVNLGNPTLSAEFTFENNPGELLGGIGGVAMIGIAAAIAVPAYQDYKVRAMISEGLSLSGSVKAAIAEFYFENQRFPGEEEAVEMSLYDLDSESVLSVTVEANTGRIIVQYADSVAGGGEVVLEASVDVGAVVSWSCGGSFEDKHLPAACRDGSVVNYEDGDT